MPTHLLHGTKNLSTLGSARDSMNVRSCASNCQQFILSGFGSDGTEGVMEIKKKGGMVMARNPETSEFSSMPAHAIATGMVDFILEPEAMPAAIEAYVEKEGKLMADSPEDQLLILETNFQ